MATCIAPASVASSGQNYPINIGFRSHVWGLFDLSLSVIRPKVRGTVGLRGSALGVLVESVVESDERSCGLGWSGKFVTLSSRCWSERCVGWSGALVMSRSSVRFRQAAPPKPQVTARGLGLSRVRRKPAVESRLRVLRGRRAG
jgi:hypothetical protein